MKTAAFHDPVYNFTVHLLWESDGPQSAAYMRTNFPEVEVDKTDEDDEWGGRHMMLEFSRAGKNHEIHLVMLREFQGTIEDISVLAHELLHATHDVLYSRGLRLTDDTVEAFAYLHDSLVRRCLEALK